MNSHQRRIVNRKWPHAIIVEDNEIADECMIWLRKNMGSCDFAQRRWPRWCWRPSYLNLGNFSVAQDGVELFFRRDKDYAWFLLKWNR